MNAFYQSYPIRNALRTELSWINYRSFFGARNRKRVSSRLLILSVGTGPPEPLSVKLGFSTMADCLPVKTVQQ